MTMTDLHDDHATARELHAHKLQERAAQQLHAMELEAARCWTPSEVAAELFGDGKRVFGGVPVHSVAMALRLGSGAYGAALQHFRSTLEEYPDRPQWVVEHLVPESLQSLALQHCARTLDVDPKGTSMAAWVHSKGAEFEDQLFDPSEVRRWFVVNFVGAAPVTDSEVISTPPTIFAVHQESQEQRRLRRYLACIEAGLPMPKDDYGRLPNGIGRLAAVEGISTPAFAKDLKRHLATKRQPR